MSENFVEGQVAMPHRVAQGDLQRRDRRPEVGEFAIDENFPESVPVFDILVVEAGEQMPERFLPAAEASGFARQAIEPDERGVVAGRLDGALDVVGFLQSPGKIVSERNSEKLFASAVSRLDQDIRGNASTGVTADSGENLKRRGMGFAVAPIAEAGVDQTNGFIVETEVEEC